MSDCHIVNSIDSIIPVITKCEFNEENDLKCIQSDLNDVIQQHFVAINKNKMAEKDEDDKKFANNFAFKFLIFDPLDRDIGFTDDNDQYMTTSTQTKMLK